MDEGGRGRRYQLSFWVVKEKQSVQGTVYLIQYAVVGIPFLDCLHFTLTIQI